MSDTHRDKTDKRLDKLESEVEAIRQSIKEILELKTILIELNEKLSALLKY